MKLGILVIGLALAGCAARTDQVTLTMPPGASVQHMNLERDALGHYTIHDTAFYNNAELEIPQQ